MPWCGPLPPCLLFGLFALLIQYDEVPTKIKAQE
jgi:hypothetical protein